MITAIDQILGVLLDKFHIEQIVVFNPSGLHARSDSDDTDNVDCGTGAVRICDEYFYANPAFWNVDAVLVGGGTDW